MAAAEEPYPWFRVVTGETLEQGDILEQCPVFSPPPGLPSNLEDLGKIDLPFDYKYLNVVVMTQSCDLADGKAEEVLLCPIWGKMEYKEGELSKAENWENARKGRFPAYHVLNKCSLPNFARDYRIVDFRRVYTLPLVFLQERARASSGRVRLMPPYREHLAQAFARFFMRIGLPVDIPQFK